MRRLLLPALILIAPAVGAQDIGARTSPQFIRYTLGAPSNNTISEMVLPVFAFMPVNQMLTLDLGTAFASAHVTNNSGGQAVESSISGLTDTQLRGTLNFGDAVVVTLGVNVPTGQSTAKNDQQAAAALIGNDFLAFPISSMGSGFGGTGGLAFARPVGDWSLGAGLSVRHSMPFDPYEGLRYVPGNETRVRVGLDHPYRAGRGSIGLTYSKFSNDALAGSAYNTGDRLLAQGYLTDKAGEGDYVLSAWNLFRASGTRFDSTKSGTENITDVSAAYGMTVGGARLEPGLDLRTWMQQDQSMSLQTTVSLRYDREMGQFVVGPSAGFTFGKLAAQDAGVNTTASISGFRLSLTIRTR